MATDASLLISDSAILSRLIFPEGKDFSVEAARGFLSIRYQQHDLDRIHELVVKNQDDQLTSAEQTELDNYRRVSYLLDLMHSKARLVLKKHQKAD